jgi:hypothetical protein
VSAAFDQLDPALCPRCGAELVKHDRLRTRILVDGVPVVVLVDPKDHDSWCLGVTVGSSRSYLATAKGPVDVRRGRPAAT